MFGINAFDFDKGTEVMKDKVSQENVYKEEVPLNNNMGKQSGDLVEMPSEAIEKGMDNHVPNEIDGNKGEQVPNHVVKKGILEFLVKCKYVTRNTGKGPQNEDYTDSVRLYDVTPAIVLRRNLFKAIRVTQQDYGVTRLKIYVVTLLIWKDKLSESALTWTLDYTVTSSKPARWKVHVSSLRHNSKSINKDLIQTI
ncbi:hypothetical protein Tco_1279453 [Tanacetum coccineum]